ncbi:MAG: alkaline phosphatase D family protein [Phycisphaerales bacterium]
MLISTLSGCLLFAMVVPPVPANLLGPFPGHVGTNEAAVWARADGPGALSLYLFDVEGTYLRRIGGEAKSGNDCCVTWYIDGLTAGTAYQYVIRPGSAEGEDDRPRAFDVGVMPLHTLKDHALPGRVSILLGSCESDALDQPQPIFSTMLRQNPTALVLLGDTPYIDTTNLVVQRRRRREFFACAELAALRRVTPTYVVWDDHDFGANDTDGKLSGKANSRRAFLEYHANARNADDPSPGDGAGEQGQGIYSRFRQGPVEVFLIDARWFAGTEPSFADATKPTLIGARQWAWLRRELKASTATFKVLATGMVWNDTARPSKKDHWGTYKHERDALFKFVQEERIDGVVLAGGDIHRSRAFKHGTAWSGVGYPVYEIVSSPLGQSPLVTPNQPDPALLFDRGEYRAFAVMEGDSTVTPATLTVRWLTGGGVEFYRLQMTADELRHK